jgi:hypothetical protein
MLLALLYGVPSLFAATPGLIALGARRRILGVVLLLGAALAIGLPIYADHVALREAAARGEFRDDIAFLFLPALFGVTYAFLAGFVLAAFSLFDRFFGKEDGNV